MSVVPGNTAEFLKAFRDYADSFVVIGGTPTLLYRSFRSIGDI